jgi:hypothetical protein
MHERSVRVTRALLCIAVASLVVACAKDDVAPVDVEKQAFADFRTEIRELIDDPAREAEAIKLVGMLEQNLADLRSSIATRKNRARELNADYDTQRAEFDAFLAGIEAEVQDNRRRVTETHRAFHAHVTAEERATIAKAHTKAMKAAIKTIQTI